MDLGISGKRALVLAASRGLGLGIAKALAAEGVHVLICGRTEERLKANVEAMRAAGGKADYVVADLADAHFVDQMLHAVHDKLGGIDILVNNTGGPTPGTVEDMDADKLYTFFQSMVVRVITLTNALVPLMKTQGFGRILTVASSGVFEPIPNLALSNTLRGALSAGTRPCPPKSPPMASPPTCCCLAAFIPTGSTNWTAPTPNARQVARRSARCLGQVDPAQRLGTVENSLPAVAFLCSAQASYITGTMLRVDGGAAKSN